MVRTTADHDQLSHDGERGAERLWVTTNHQAGASKFQNLREPGAGICAGPKLAGWHHWRDGRESEWTPGVGDGQGGLVCCDSWGRKESETTERLNWTELKTQISGGDSEVSTVSTSPQKKALTEETDNTAAAKTGQLPMGAWGKPTPTPSCTEWRRVGWA